MLGNASQNKDFVTGLFSLLSGSFLQRKRESRHESIHRSETSALLFVLTSLERYKKKKAAFSFRSPNVKDF